VTRKLLEKAKCVKVLRIAPLRDSQTYFRTKKNKNKQKKKEGFFQRKRKREKKKLYVVSNDHFQKNKKRK
jgi:hypothetical protein